ncbi:MAG: zf-HC2 domain-containing protein [Actinomycetota bacterium]|nr:zf-HC2 domain-containing protein [Actinomycetota bacterium]
MRLRFEPHAAAGLYATNALSGRRRRSFERHVAHCERCQANLHWLAETAAALALVVEPIEPPPSLRGRILAAALAEGGR